MKEIFCICYEVQHLCFAYEHVSRIEVVLA